MSAYVIYVMFLSFVVFSLISHGSLHSCNVRVVHRVHYCGWNSNLLPFAMMFVHCFHLVADIIVNHIGTYSVVVVCWQQSFSVSILTLKHFLMISLPVLVA